MYHTKTSLEFYPKLEVETEEHVLEGSSLNNLTVSTIPDISTHIVLAPPVESNLSDRIIALLKEHGTEIVKIAGAGHCAKNLIAKVPRVLLVKLDLLLSQYNKCNTAVTAAIHTIGNLLKGNDEIISIPRLLIEQLAEVVDGLKGTEARITQEVAFAKILSNSISTSDMQTPSDPDIFENEMLEIKAPIPAIEAVADVINEAPQSIGLPANNDYGNEVVIDVDVLGANVTNSSTIVEEAKEGLEELFSATTLMSPLDCLPIDLDQEVFYSLKEIEVVTDKDKGTKVKILANVADTIKKTDVNTKQSFVEMISEAEEKLAQIHPDRTIAMADPRAQGILDSLGKVWSKIKNTKLPSPQHIMAAKDILSTGLQVTGAVLGNEKVSGAAKLLNSIDLSPLNIPKETRFKNMFNIVPNLVEVGFANLANRSVSSDDIIRQASDVDLQIKNNIIEHSNSMVYSHKVRRALARRR